MELIIWSYHRLFMKTAKDMTEAAYKLPFCRVCKTPLTKKQMDKIIKERFIPLCPEHYDRILANLKKCLPLMKKLKLS